MSGDILISSKLLCYYEDLVTRVVDDPYFSIWQKFVGVVKETVEEMEEKVNLAEKELGNKNLKKILGSLPLPQFLSVSNFSLIFKEMQKLKLNLEMLYLCCTWLGGGKRKRGGQGRGRELQVFHPAPRALSYHLYSYVLSYLISSLRNCSLRQHVIHCFCTTLITS